MGSNLDNRDHEAELSSFQGNVEIIEYKIDHEDSKYDCLFKMNSHFIISVVGGESDGDCS